MSRADQEGEHLNLYFSNSIKRAHVFGVLFSFSDSVRSAPNNGRGLAAYLLVLFEDSLLRSSSSIHVRSLASRKQSNDVRFFLLNDLCECFLCLLGLKTSCCECTEWQSEAERVSLFLLRVLNCILFGAMAVSETSFALSILSPSPSFQVGQTASLAPNYSKAIVS